MKMKKCLSERKWPTFWLKEKGVVQHQLLVWHQKNGRHGLPWKGQDPYAIWVSEIMLQQTQVKTVLPKFKAWMETFPTIEILAQSSQDEVFKHWEGLGYYHRAKNLHKTAKILCEEYDGKMPQSREARLSLPGIGPSTASAIGAFAFGMREAIFDGNVQRIWSRWWGDRLSPLLDEKEKWEKVGWKIAEQVMPQEPKEIQAWTQAVMDLGATICLPKKPLCSDCPWQKTCRAYQTQTIEHYPPKKKKITVLAESLEWAWLVNEKNQVGILPPTDKGKWPGLWQLPSVSFLNQMTFPKEPQKMIASGFHLLTHRKIAWHLYQKEIPGAQNPFSELSNKGKSASEILQWVNLEEWDQKAWPGFIRKWWDSLDKSSQRKLFHSSELKD